MRLLGEPAEAGSRRFTVRPAAPVDVPGLARVAERTFPLACPPTTTDRAKAAFIAEHLSPSRFASHLGDDSRRVLVADRDGELVGYTLLVFAESADPDVLGAVTARPMAELSKCYVLPEAHGAGIAQALIEASVDEARRRGIRSLWLGVNQHNARANRFYEKCGFRRVGVKRFLVGEAWEDDFVRERTLGQ